jgi:hypothetical protein
MIIESTQNYEKYDAAYGIVTSRCKSGAFIELDNGEAAFCYTAANVSADTKIICTILRPAYDGKRCLVSLDSVCSCYEVA